MVEQQNDDGDVDDSSDYDNNDEQINNKYGCRGRWKKKLQVTSK